MKAILETIFASIWSIIKKNITNKNGISIKADVPTSCIRLTVTEIIGIIKITPTILIITPKNKLSIWKKVIVNVNKLIEKVLFRLMLFNYKTIN